MKLIMMAVLLLFCCRVSATVQAKEAVEYAGKTYILGLEKIIFGGPMWHFPLDSYLKRENIELGKLIVPYQKVFVTACWRGYVGTWRIDGGRFYLVKLGQFPMKDEPAEDYPLTLINKAWKSPVPAEWYTGAFLLYEYSDKLILCIPKYQVEVKDGKVEKLVRRSHFLEDLPDKLDLLEARLKEYAGLPDKPWHLLAEGDIRGLMYELRKVSPGASMEEVENLTILLYPEATEKIPTENGYILRYYTFKQRKETAGEKDIWFDFIFRNKNTPEGSGAGLEKVTLHCP